MDSYEQACAHLQSKIRFDEQSEKAYEIACGDRMQVINPHLFARLYGQYTAISADHLGRPEELLDPAAAEMVESLLQFLGLALENEGHFLPSAARNWRRFHREAVELVLAARRRSLAGLDLQREFERARASQAFGDHFLQDSFSAGHSGFARVSSRPSVAGAIHDRFNDSGRVLMNGNGERWYGYGDGHLGEDRNHVNWLHAAHAAESSVESFLLAFITGQDQPDADLRIWMQIPVAASDTDRFAACIQEHWPNSAECTDPDWEIPLSVSIQRSAFPTMRVRFDYLGSMRREEKNTYMFGGTVSVEIFGTYATLSFNTGTSHSQPYDYTLFGLGLGLEQPLYSHFPWPVSLNAFARATGALADGTAGASKENDTGTVVQLSVGLRLDLDIGKAWAMSFGSGICDWRTTLPADTPHGFTPCLYIGLDHVLATEGGGHR
jgi:hypothetical protein